MFAHTIVVVPHVHWDREWYFTSAEAQLLAIKDLTEIIEYLEQHPSYPSFTLDGQMAFIDEYLESMPHMRPRMEQLVRAGRLHIGPWYTQTDEMAVGAEALIRNLQCGISCAQRLGGAMMIGYLPDSFGQSAGLPRILSGFGIQRAVFWRGLSEYAGTNHNVFTWSADTNSGSVDAWMLPLGYATGKYLSCDPQQLAERFSPLMELFDSMSPRGIAILPHGHDQMPLQTTIEDALAALRQAFPERRFILGSYQDAFDLNEQAGHTFGNVTFETSQNVLNTRHGTVQNLVHNIDIMSQPPLDQVSGELLWGKRERVHRSIGSVRMDILTRNVEAERLLVHEVEPLSVLSQVLGYALPQALIDQAWKLLLENHAHDSMGGCCSDQVNQQIRMRAEQAVERARIMSTYMRRTIVEATAAPYGCNERLGLFNLSLEDTPRHIETELVWHSPHVKLVDTFGNEIPYTVLSCEPIDPGLVDRQLAAGGRTDPFYALHVELTRALAPMSYEVLGMCDGAPKQQSYAQHTTLQTDEDYHASSPYHDMLLYANGSYALTDSVTGAYLDKLCILSFEPNAGDSYDFSPLPDQPYLTTYASGCSKRTVRTTPVSTQIQLHYSVAVPANLKAWKHYQAHDRYETRSVELWCTLTLSTASPCIDIELSVANTADDLRIRMLLPVGTAVDTSVADTHHGTVTRPALDPAYQVWERDGWSERPDGIYPFLRYVSAGHIHLFSASSREYELVQTWISDDNSLHLCTPTPDAPTANTLAITLLCGTGTLGASELLRRPGRPSGIGLPTPDAQQHVNRVGSINHRFGLYTGSASTLEQTVQSWLSPILCYEAFTYTALQLNQATRALPPHWALGLTKQAGIALLACKLLHTGQLADKHLTDDQQLQDASKLRYIVRVMNTHERSQHVTLAGGRILQRTTLNEEALICDDPTLIAPGEVASFLVELTEQPPSIPGACTYRPSPVVGHVRNG